MTEQEARTKWCPLSRMLMDPAIQDMRSNGLPVAGFNRVKINQWAKPIIAQGTNCIASDCMMWRDGNCGLICGPERKQNHESKMEEV